MPEWLVRVTMARPIFLVSTVITGLLLVFVAGFTLRGRERRRPLVTPDVSRAVQSRVGDGDRIESPVSGTAVAGLLLAFLLLGAGIAVGSAAGGGLLAVGIGAFAGLQGIYLVWGVYHIARVRGLQRAQAVGIGAWFLGLLLLTGIVIKLVLGG